MNAINSTCYSMYRQQFQSDGSDQLLVPFSLEVTCLKSPGG